MVKSPLRYPGGKSRAVAFLSAYVPPYQEFREVFFGGGSLSFYQCQKTPDAIYEASDLNYELWCFWTQLKRNPEAVRNGVQELYHAFKREDRDGKELFQLLAGRRNDALSELQRAIDFYVLNRITFSGVVDSGGYSQGSFDGRFTQSSIDKLSPTSRIIQRIGFSCEDYTHLLQKPSDDVFVFLDPPYYAATKSKLYGKNGLLHTSFDHERLLAELKQCPHKWLITYDNSDFIRDLYKDFFLHEWKLQYGMTQRNNATTKPGNELLIANYDLAETAARNNGEVHNLLF